MNFLYPNYLYALVLIAIPIIIHFFNFQRAKRVYFTNVAFLKTVKQVSNARSRIKNILVLLSRILFIVALVIAFARPYIDVGGGVNANLSNLVSIYMDNSFSMQSENEGKRLLETGKTYIDQIGTLFPKNTRYQLLDNGFEVNSRYFFEASKLSEKATTLDFSAAGRQISQVYQRQAEAIAQNSGVQNSRIFIISDFQKSTAGDLKQLAADSLHQIYLVPLTPSSQPNLTIDSVWLLNPFIKPKEATVLYVKITNYGDQAIKDKNITLSIGDKQVSATTVSIAENSTEILPLTFAIAESGEQKCKIAVEDYPLTFDNEYFFVLHIAPTIKIANVSAQNAQVITDVYAGESFFEVVNINLQNPDYNALAAVDIIVVENIKEIDNALLASLTKALRENKTVVVFPHENINIESYNAAFGLLFSHKEIPTTNFNDYKIGLEAPENGNPFFEGVFEKLATNITMPKSIPVIGWNSTGQTLLKFKNGTPFLTLIAQEESKLFLFASPLKADYSDLQAHALFLPIMYKIALTTAGKSERLAYSFEEDLAKITSDSLKKGDIFRLSNGITHFIPHQRVHNKELIINIPKGNINAGVYEVYVENRQNTTPYGIIAFNYSNTESKAGYYTSDELKEIFKGTKNIKVFEVEDPQEFRAEFTEKTSAIPLWRYALITALIALLIEILLIRYWKKS
jgi:hypothetical protein